MTEIVEHEISAIFGGKVVRWTYKGPSMMKKPKDRVFLVPYHYPRDRTWRFRAMRDNPVEQSRRRIIKLHRAGLLWRPERSERTNWFKHNVEIRFNFKSCAYANRWY